MTLQRSWACVLALVFTGGAAAAGGARPQTPPAPPPAQTASALVPTRLTDTEFWTLFRSMSEPPGNFQSDNFVGNELTFQWVIPDLVKTVQPGGAYVGVGPDQNFTYISALRPRIAFIVDVRHQNALQLLMYKALFELSADRAEFAARLFGRTKPTGLKPDASADDVLSAVYAKPASRQVYEDTLQAIKDHLTKTHGFALDAGELRDMEYVFGSFFSFGPGIAYANGNGRASSTYPTYWDMQVTDDNHGKNWAYMGTEDQFRSIKRLEEANLIVPVTGNFAGPKAVKAVGAWLRARNATVTTFYTSNVEQYLFQDGIWGDYYRNVATMPLDSTSTFIRSVFNGLGGYSYGALRSAQLTSSIPGLLEAFKNGKIASYYDVLAFSK